MRCWIGVVVAVAVGPVSCGSGEVDPCADVECPSSDPCIEDGVCDSGENDGYCDGMGVCVQCTLDSQCADGNECTADLCDPNTRSCQNPDIEVEMQCDGGFCIFGVCVVFSCEGVEDGTFCAPELRCMPPSPMIGECARGTCQCVLGA